MRTPASIGLLVAVAASLIASSRPAIGDSLRASADPRGLARATALQDSGSGITRDVGSIAIIEHDGSNYDRSGPGGAPNASARMPVARRFYETHGDLYDFLVVFTNFEFDTGDAVAFHLGIRNDVQGVGLPQFDNGPDFGSPGRLRGYVDMAAVDRYRQPAYGLQTGDPGFRVTLNVLAHELGHQWLAQVRYRDASGSLSSDLLGKDGSHWSYLLDSDASVMYGSEWTANGNGTYTATRIKEGYSPLDLYLMGFLDPVKVSPFTLLRNNGIDPRMTPEEGVTIAATPETVALDQVIAAEGPRVPGWRTSPKTFRVGFIFLTAPGVDPSADDLEAVERVRQAFVGHFFALTRGAAIADTSLAETAPVTHASAPDLDKAIEWLLSRQSIDGRFEDSAGTTVRDTAVAIDALASTGQPGAAMGRALAWMQGADVGNLDFASRRAGALARGAAGAPSSLAPILVTQQNPDGGFGIAAGYESDALDTSLALRALKALGRPLDASVRRAVASLAAQRHPSGAWPLVAGGEPSTIATAQALLALQDWRQADGVPALLGAGAAALLARRNPDGGFGESPSTPYATALALQALAGASAPAETIDAAIGWLQSTQLTDGSWDGSVYQTALVLDALRGGVRPNLTVPPDSLVLVPAAPREGEVVHISATVQNTGRTPAVSSRARLYEGDPTLGVVVAEAGVPALGPGESAPVAFDYATADRAGARTLYVVADAAEEVAESREDDNATSRSLAVSGLLADLQLRPGDLTATPNPAEEGETVQVSITVANVGQRRAGASVVRLFDGDPRGGGHALGAATLPELDPGQSGTTVLPWSTAGAAGSHVLFAVADATYVVAESDEANNELSLPVTVGGPLPPGPDVEVQGVAATPGTLSTIPQPVELRAAVRNLGRDAATTLVSVFDGDALASSSLAEVPITLGPRSSTNVTFSVVIDRPGSRTFVVIADAAGTLQETSETNNSASVTVTDPGNTLDIEIEPGTATASPADLVVGETLTVTGRVRNRGTAPVVDVPVVLLHRDASGAAELARTLVSLAPGADTFVTLSWTTSLAGDPLPLVLDADPFDLLAEVSEANNEAALSVRIRPSGLPNLRTDGSSIAFQPDPPLEGGSARLSAVVRNLGTAAAPTFSVGFYRGDPTSGGPLLGEAHVAGLDPNAETQVSIDWSPVDVRGAQGLFVLADSRGGVTEYDEGDNLAFRPFAATGLPDLVLTAGDVGLQPPFPHAGESVTVRATVRNLGGQAAPPTTVRAYEGEPVTGTLVADVRVQRLDPGQSADLEFPWTPAAPPGERTLSLVADADATVAEQGEGNNVARRSVLVQDADLYLTAPFFSPDGDGVQDETTLGYRASNAVTALVSDSRGRRIRSLGQGAAAGAFTWDGRDDQGRLLFDGSYTISLLGEGGVVLGRVEAVLDTNRSSIHDAAGTGLVAFRNTTCALPDVLAHVWFPGEDEQLLIVYGPPAFPLGLVRATLDGEFSYVSQDSWFENARFASAGAVSPTGREVLMLGGGDLVAFDLATASRRVVLGGVPDVVSDGVREALFRAVWSPDGRWIATSQQVLAADGSPVADLPVPGDWVWSPDGERLAWGNVTVRRDGTDSRQVALPDGLQMDAYLKTIWRGDGAIFVTTGRWTDDSEPRLMPATALLIDPGAGTAVELVALRGADVDSWSADGSKALIDGEVVREDGSARMPFLPAGSSASPRVRVASYESDQDAQPGKACFGNGYVDVFAAQNLGNLTVELAVFRLPANNGLLLRGTVSDGQLDHYLLEWASASAPDVWRPLTPASESIVLDDILTTWVPDAPGTYTVRLTAWDRAGNTRARTRVVAWDRVAAIANITASESLISPNADGVKDAVRFDYLVLEATHVDVQVSGPEGGSGLAPTIRRFGFDQTRQGPAFFDWDGRDEQGQVAPDGRYTVEVNGLPFRVDVDSTPPDIAWAYQHVHSETREKWDADLAKLVKVSEVVADRLWHAVDPHLKSWRGPGGFGVREVYEPETDANGVVVLENWKPRIKRLGNRAADATFDEYESVLLGLQDADGPTFTAEDSAGNRSVVAVLPVEERLFLLKATAPGKDAPAIRAPVGAETYALGIRTTFTLAETLRGTPPEGETIRFQFQEAPNGPWTVAASFEGSHRFGWDADFAQIGIPFGRPLRGRFAATARSGVEVRSEEFAFRICDAGIQMLPVGVSAAGGGLAVYAVEIVSSGAVEPLVGATLTVLGPSSSKASYPMDVESLPSGGWRFSRTVVAPSVSCGVVPPQHLEFAAVVTDRTGRVYRDDGACVHLVQTLPVCLLDLQIRRKDPGCGERSPDRIPLRVWGRNGTPSATVTIDRGPAAGQVLIDGFDVGPGEFSRDVVADVAGLPEGDLTVRGQLVAVTGDSVSTALTMTVDRTPPTAQVTEPKEGGQACVRSMTVGQRVQEWVRLAVDARDAGGLVELASVEMRQGAGPWEPMPSGHFRGGQSGENAGGDYSWDVTALPDGLYGLRLTFCDRSGLTTLVERNLFLTRQPPFLAVEGVARAIFSPNGDGKADTTALTLRLTQPAAITAQVVGPGSGGQPGAVVRSLFLGQTLPAGPHALVWDGRNDAGVVVPDGSYVLNVSASDSCGRSADPLFFRLTVDTLAPTVTILAPASGDSVGASADVRGIATDDHFESWALSWGVGAEPPAWTDFGNGPAAPTPTLLKSWVTPITPGTYTLRLVATDAAGNSAEARVGVTVRMRTALDRFSVVPELFSPNGDGRRDTITVEYALGMDAEVLLEIRDAGNNVVRSLDGRALRYAGSYAFVWDGLDNSGRPAPEGDLTVQIRAFDPLDSPRVIGQETAGVVLDRTPPRIEITRPLKGTCLRRVDEVHGSIEDPRMAAFSVAATPTGGAPVELSHGAQSLQDADLASLAGLREGIYGLSVAASDTAESRSTADIGFTIDSIPPVARILAPAPGAVLLRSATPIEITGTVTDDNLRERVLSFGPGSDPSYFVEISRVNGVGVDVRLGVWDVAGLADGVYTLRLQATDCAGSVTEDRRTLTLDGIPPTARITDPAEAAAVRQSPRILGTAADTNLASWELHSSPGAAASAFQWTPLASGESEVKADLLATWEPLPPDGVHTLRLRVTDRAGHEAVALRTVTVDTTPPAVPAGLAAQVHPAGGSVADVLLSWNANTEPDLAGYRVARDDQELTPVALSAPAYTDGSRPDGTFRYTVVAVDRAGNVSPPAALPVRVDLTPPVADIAWPVSGASLSGSIDVRGTAFSPDDFKEYRVLVGSGAAPSSWTLLHRSTLGVSGGVLGAWNAVVDGTYVLAVEAEDLSGNVARTTASVTVDTQAPTAPVLTAVDVAADPASLVVRWDASSSSDVSGYLVQRGGRIANAPGIVLGDLRAYLVPAPSYLDASLPDGNHCYRAVAMDLAGNLSPPSNEICRSLDTRPPHATILEPANGSRFDQPVHVTAYTPDTDIASVRFELRPHGNGAWSALGAADSQPPFETSLDPAALTPGPYDLRAVAIDQGGRVDPAPDAILVTYGDATAPQRPQGLVAQVDGADVHLTWSANTEADLAGYHVTRDGARLTTAPTTSPQFTDTGVGLGFHEYAVTAVDLAGNESTPAAVSAVVYALSLEQPYPVTRASTGSLTGLGARAETTVEVIAGTTVVAQGPGSSGSFRVDAVPLVTDANILRARGVDAAGNRSIPSGEAVVISNVAPQPVASVSASVTDHDVHLAWSPATDGDLFGYLVRRDGVLLTLSAAQTTAQSVTADSTFGVNAADHAFDGDPGTAWVSQNPTGTWTVRFAQAILIERVRLHFFAAGAVRYRIAAHWMDRFLTLAAGERDDPAEPADHLLPSAFATDSLLVEVQSDSMVGLAEVEVSRSGALGGTSFDETGVPDGRHAYEVTAIDRYGAEGPAGTAEAAVGDVDPPDPPMSLTATAAGADVVLTWTPSAAPDVALYRVLRDGAVVATSTVPSRLDPGVPDGLHTYTVVAVDAFGNESAPSNPAQVTVSTPRFPLPAPIILFPTDAAHPIVVGSPTTVVRGRSTEGAAVSLDVNGGLVGVVEATADRSVLETLSLHTPADAVSALVSSDGRTVAYGVVDANGRRGVRLLDVASRTSRALDSGGFDELLPAAFSNSGDRLQYFALRGDGQGGLQSALFIVDLVTDARTLVDENGENQYEASWSPDGRRIAFSTFTADAIHLFLRDLDAGTTAPLLSVAGTDDLAHLEWSPDGARIAFLFYPAGSPADLRVLDLAPGQVSVVDVGVSDATPDWSPDGSRLAYVTGEDPPAVVVRDLATDARSRVGIQGGQSSGPRFDPAGARLGFIVPSATVPGLRDFVAQELATGARQVVTDIHEQLAPRWIRDGRIALSLQDRVGLFDLGAGGMFEFPEVSLGPGDNLLTARATEPSTGETSPPSDPVKITVAPEVFPDLAVSAGDLAAYPQVPVPGGPAIVSARIHNVGASGAVNVPVSLTVIDGLGNTIVGTSATLSQIAPGASVLVSVPWAPVSAGDYQLRARADEAGAIAELREDNNEAVAGIFVTSQAGFAAGIQSDRAAYQARATAAVTVRVNNAGPVASGTARTTVEDAAGREVAVLDVRTIALDYGQASEWLLGWDVGATYAGAYSFHVRVSDAGGTPQASAQTGFSILPDIAAAARLVPDRAVVPAGSAASFAAHVENRGVNAPLAGYVARLRLLPQGGSVPVYSADTTLPTLLPGGSWDASLVWPLAGPAGTYDAELQVTPSGGAPLATAAASITVVPAVASLSGSLVLVPADVLAGDVSQAHLTVTNSGPLDLLGVPVAVEVVSGGTGAVLLKQAVALDLAAGATTPAIMPLDTTAIAPGTYPVFLRAGTLPTTHDRTTLRVHAVIAAPSIDAPADGARVRTSHPSLTVNNASSGDGSALTYSFELFKDAGVTQPVAGATGVPEGAGRTSWRVDANLGEDMTFYWRARATDGFSWSAWTAIASFTVDAQNLPPSAPMPDTPAPGARVATRQPLLTVVNATDPELDSLSYDFRVGTDADLATIVVEAAGVPEGLDRTAWAVPILLDEDATYYWSARASDAGGASPWSVPVAFVVDSIDQSPSAPVLRRPADGAEVTTLWPELAAGNGSDPEGEALTYVFQVDAASTFDSPALQTSPGLAEGLGETAWTPPQPLADNTECFWRVSASDGHTSSPWATARFFVSLANDPPTAPAPLDPGEGQVVTTLTATLRLRNASDPDRDVLTYEFEVTAEDGTVVASAANVPEGPTGETLWTTSTPLTEDARFRWSARAHDADTPGPWSAPVAFRVNAVNEPPTAPVLVSPPDGAVLDTPHPTLAVANATSQDGKVLTYAFELYSVDAAGALTLVDSATNLTEGPGETSWTPSNALGDGSYGWRSRAYDGLLYGPWMTSARFQVAVDVPPAPPTGLRATPGDRLVALSWNASTETDVYSYGVYRGTQSGGPYARIATPVTPSFSDTGLTNGTTYYYVVTARDARFESGYSAQVAATPSAPVATGPVLPILECVTFGRHSYTAVFGYKNENTVSIAVPIGSGNKFTPAPADRGQPTTFLPGRRERVFQVPFTSGNLVWTLKGRTATASPNSRRCSCGGFPMTNGIAPSSAAPVAPDGPPDADPGPTRPSLPPPPRRRSP